MYSLLCFICLHETAVNEGPIEICKKFLKHSLTPLSDLHKNRLKQVLQEFLDLCRNAVALNKNLITSDQVEFQSALEEGFSKLKRRMNRYISGKPHKVKTGDESGTFP